VTCIRTSVYSIVAGCLQPVCLLPDICYADNGSKTSFEHTFVFILKLGNWTQSDSILSYKLMQCKNQFFF